MPSGYDPLTDDGEFTIFPLDGFEEMYMGVRSRKVSVGDEVIAWEISPGGRSGRTQYIAYKPGKVAVGDEVALLPVDDRPDMPIAIYDAPNYVKNGSFADGTSTSATYWSFGSQGGTGLPATMYRSYGEGYGDKGWYVKLKRTVQFQIFKKGTMIYTTKIPGDDAVLQQSFVNKSMTNRFTARCWLHGSCARLQVYLDGTLIADPMMPKAIKTMKSWGVAISSPKVLTARKHYITFILTDYLGQGSQNIPGGATLISTDTVPGEAWIDTVMTDRA